MHRNEQHAILFDIQRFSLHDGPGIRTTLFFKGCPLACAWCQNPESHRRQPELIFYRQTCNHCLTCAKNCPENAILENAKLRFDPSRCTACGNCVSVCPTNSLRMVGQAWTAEPLLQEALKDIDFFQDSQGGITLSGGEALMQADFLETWLPLVKQHSIHVTIETCGMVPWKTLERMIPFIDLFYYDLKHMDDGRYKQYTGAGNRIILENFSRLTGAGCRVQARMPLIPGLNTEPDNIGATARFLAGQHHDSIHLLPYHRLGESKLPRIATQQKPLNLLPLSLEALGKIQHQFEKEAIHAVLYD